ncbi:LOW QUALITY PROTEIN: hypothetical protein BU14_0303s0005 [Porphyra umbilicalis]|uniref:Uncharacterized protein n=1 Tax=Porphyra umbilicalis TaxID=2786 RepID=A0A1X6P0L9_PORUM|nr:LOW QUALITY PROTEIN: hypothetical protein BU14_0303s0005 [Porphyra umbilicalis]|eukprot:OSX74173.1 LOW QUALITY PROTEIN: hypothetical protein BU14_0303s0005 [Porphyra umbilicalis]
MATRSAAAGDQAAAEARCGRTTPPAGAAPRAAVGAGGDGNAGGGTAVAPQPRRLLRAADGDDAAARPASPRRADEVGATRRGGCTRLPPARALAYPPRCQGRRSTHSAHGGPLRRAVAPRLRPSATAVAAAAAAVAVVGTTATAVLPAAGTLAALAPTPAPAPAATAATAADAAAADVLPRWRPVPAAVAAGQRWLPVKAAQAAAVAAVVASAAAAAAAVVASAAAAAAAPLAGDAPPRPWPAPAAAAAAKGCRGGGARSSDNVGCGRGGDGSGGSGRLNRAWCRVWLNDNHGRNTWRMGEPLSGGLKAQRPRTGHRWPPLTPPAYPLSAPLARGRHLPNRHHMVPGRQRAVSCGDHKDDSVAWLVLVSSYLCLWSENIWSAAACGDSHPPRRRPRSPGGAPARVAAAAAAWPHRRPPTRGRGNAGGRCGGPQWRRRARTPPAPARRARRRRRRGGPATRARPSAPPDARRAAAPSAPPRVEGCARAARRPRLPPVVYELGGQTVGTGTHWATAPPVGRAAHDGGMAPYSGVGAVTANRAVVPADTVAAGHSNSSVGSITGTVRGGHNGMTCPHLQCSFRSVSRMHDHAGSRRWCRRLVPREQALLFVARATVPPGGLSMARTASGGCSPTQRAAKLRPPSRPPPALSLPRHSPRRRRRGGGWASMPLGGGKRAHGAPCATWLPSADDVAMDAGAWRHLVRLPLPPSRLLGPGVGRLWRGPRLESTLLRVPARPGAWRSTLTRRRSAATTLGDYKTALGGLL